MDQLKVFMFIFINFHSRAMAFPSHPGKRPTLADIVSRPGSAVGARRPQDGAGRRRGAAAAAAAEDTATGRTGADGWSTMEYSTTRMIVIYCNGLYIYITYAYIIITIMITEFMIMIME